MNSPSKIYRSAVIGLGNIGMLYDYKSATSDRILTHASAYYYHVGFDLEAGVDPNKEYKALFEKKYTTRVFSCVDDMFQDVSPEIVSICVPEEQLYEVATSVLNHKVKGIVLEKPGAKNFMELESLVNYANERSTLLFVNYFRRCEPGVVQMKEFIASLKIGNIQKVLFKYTKSFLRNASHFVDLFRFIFGELSADPVVIKNHKNSFGDFCGDVYCCFNGVDVYFHYLDEDYFRYIDGEIIGTKGVIFYKKTGRDIRMAYPEEDILFPEFSCLSNNFDQIKTEYEKFQYHVIDHVYDCLSGNSENKLSGESALRTFAIMDEISTLDSFCGV